MSTTLKANPHTKPTGGEVLLKKWWDLRQQMKQIEKEEQHIREKVKTVMIEKNLTQLRRGDYRVMYREMSRESLSRKECPPEIWQKYSKKISYPVVKVEYLGEPSDFDEDDE